MCLERPPRCGQALFVCLKGPARGRRMTPAALRSLFRHHRQTTSVMKANPHRFRHTFASDMVRAGISFARPHATHGACTDSNHHGLHSALAPRCLGTVRSRGCSTHPAPSTTATMRLKKLPFPSHSLTKFFQPAAESVSTSLSDSSVRCYRYTVRSFLMYLGAQYPEIHSLEQLRRDPHLLGWLAFLRSHNPPLAAHTRARSVIHLRRMLEELAWTQQIPALAHLLVPDDVPRREHYLPRPLTPEQDQLIQQELLRRDDFTSNALLLIRHTGMRIGECIDLSVDCLRSVAPDQWAIHVPLGKLKTERWVPVDSLVCQLVARLRSCARRMHPAPVVCFCQGRVAITCCLANSATPCTMSQRRSELAPTSSRTRCATHMPRRCSAPASP
jgi:site-specific recombinase XerD